MRYGLSAIKGIGQSAVSGIIDGRKSRPYTSIFDFTERVGVKGAGKRVLESLICAGAFDSMKADGAALHNWRASLHATVDRALECGARQKREQSSGQFGMFGMASDDASDAEDSHQTLEFATAWTRKELLTFEKSAIGFYVSGHPLDDFIEKIGQLNCKTVADLTTAEPQSHVRLAGVVSDFTVRNTKKGDRYAFFRLEDLSGAGVKCVLWPEAFKSKGKEAANDALLLVTGKLDGGQDSLPTIVCDEIYSLEKARIRNSHFGVSYAVSQDSTQTLLIEFPAHDDAPAMYEKVSQTLLSHPGDCDVLFDIHLREDGVRVRLRPARAFRVASGQPLEDALNAAGVSSTWVDPNPAQTAAQGS
ncbi:MAG: hypothetical protein LC754_18410 [Acidobacteria bacterium]|nr:hypothetical protein [Acidobacteriota bacterium]